MDMVAKIAVSPRRKGDWRRLVAETRRRSFWDPVIGELLDYTYSDWAKIANSGMSEHDLGVMAVARMVESCTDQRMKAGAVPDNPAHFRAVLAGLLGLRSRGTRLLRQLVEEAVSRP